MLTSEKSIKTPPRVELLLGDCQELLKAVPDSSVALVLTDPPYWHKKSPGKPYAQRNPYKTKSKYANSELFNVQGDVLTKMSDFGEESINSLMRELKRVMAKMNAYIFCNDTQVAYYSMWAERNGYMFTILVWEKPLSIINKNRYSQNVEYIIRIYEYGTGLNRLAENEYYNKVKRVRPILGKQKLHPTQKPVELLKQIILLSTQEGQVVLDPYMGSGSTAVACIETGRDFIGIEIEKKYYNLAAGRVGVHNGEKQG